MKNSKFLVASMVVFVFLASSVAVAQTVTTTATGPRTSISPTGQRLGEVTDTLTSPGLEVRVVLPFPAPADRTVFKEITPCRLVDTRVSVGMASQYGSLYSREEGDFGPGESRTYRFNGSFADPGTTNPCNGKIPATGVVALTLQVWIYNPNDTQGVVGFTTPAIPKLKETFVSYKVGVTVQAGQVQILDQSTFTVVNQLSMADIAIEILGYHTPDAGAVGPVGPSGIGNMTMERKCACFVTSTATVTFSKSVYFVLSQYENMDGKTASAPINYAGSEGRTATFNGSVGRNFCAYNFSQ